MAGDFPLSKDFMKDEHVYAFEQIPHDARIAYCLGDLDLDDILSVELTDGERFKLAAKLTRWGKSQGIEE